MNAQTPFDPMADFDPALDPYHASDDDIDRVVGGFKAQTAVQINRGLDVNPDDAAEAEDLSKVTGVSAPWTLTNLDEQRDQVRKYTAQQLVLDNPDLIAYLQSHPMAAAVSSDDWGNLDKFTREASTLASINKFLNAPFEPIAESTLEGIKEGWQGADLSSTYAKYTDPGLTGPVGAIAASGGYGAANLLLQALGAVFGGVGGAAKGVGTAIGGERLGREAQSMAEYEMMRGDQTVHGAGGGEVPPPPKPDPVVLAMAKAQPWIEVGKWPPAGTDPLIDQASAKINQSMLEMMESDLKNAEASTTRERSPEIFSAATKAKFGDSTFEIHGDAALALYGDKPAEPEDGLLGWVPNIESQLTAARDTGSPVQVKISDWLTHVEPEVAKTLHDDIRMWPGGVTVNEAKEPIPPKEVVDAPLPQVRGAAGLEPKFSMGDRKLTLEPKLSEEGEEDDLFAHLRGAILGGHPEDPLPLSAMESGVAQGQKVQGKVTLEKGEGVFADEDLLEGAPPTHHYNILDEQGQPVGVLAMTPGSEKTLFVNWIGGQAGLWSNSFGPSLVRDLKRQLKALYPEYDYVTGFRVSGARDKAGTLGVAKVKLSTDESPAGWESVDNTTPEDHQRMQEIFRQGWQRYNDRMEVNRQGEDFFTPEQQEVGRVAKAELERIAGKDVSIEGVAGVRTTREDGRTVRGAWAPSRTDNPAIVLDLLGPDPVGVGRHEAIHQLRAYNFFKPEEWATLESAAKSEGWLDRYGINERYAHLDESSRLEEGVAEGFREWARQAPEIRPKTGVGAVFQKIMDFLEGVKDKLGFGKDATWEEVFDKVHSGQVARRGPGEPGMEGAFDIRQKNSMELDGTRVRIQARERAIEMIKQRIANLTPDDKYNQAVAKQQGNLGLADQLANHEKILADLKKEESRLYNRENMKTMGVTLGPKYSIEGDDNIRAQSVGLRPDSFRKVMDAAREKDRSDMEAALARAQKDQARRQTKEWKANRADMAKDVSEEIRQRPDIAADLFLGSGELGGKKIQQRFTLRADDLTPEQRAAIPEHYTSTNGLPADQVAGMFGYGSKDELVQGLGRVTAMREGAGTRLGRDEFLRQMVQTETDRRMELRHGRLDDNIMDAAQEQALSEPSLNLLHQEYMAAALEAGKTGFDREVIKQAAKNTVAAKTLGEINSFRMMQDMGKHARDAQNALAQKDFGQAMVSMQKQTLLAYAAKEAKAVEKEMKSADAMFKTNAKRTRDSVEPEYLDRVHSIMGQIVKKVDRTQEDLAREISGAGGKGLEDFVNEKTSYGQIMPVWDTLFDPKWSKPYKDLTVEEFREVRDSIKTIIKNGRDERKLIREGDAVDQEAVKTKLIGGLDQFPETPLTMEGEKNPPGVLRHTWARLLTVETILNRWDGFDWKGPWQSVFFRPLSEGANQLAAWEKDMARTFKSIVDRPSASEGVPNIVFRNPVNGELSEMTRENLHSVMLYMGSDSGFDKLVRGYSLPKFKYQLTREMVTNWVHSVMTKEDLNFVNGIHAAMEQPRHWSDTMYRSMSDRPMQGIEPTPWDTPHGKATGGYVPIRYSKFYEGKSAKLSGISLDGLFGSGYSTGFAPDATYKVERTGYAAPLDLTLNNLVPAVKQQLRDAALRPALADASRILRDPDIAAAIKTRYGSEYHEMLKEYLRRLANTENRGGPQGQYTQLAGQALEFARKNLITDLVGFNPGTVMKHGLTAFVLSAREVGPTNMLRAMRQLYETNNETGQSWRQFAYENSQELQRRDRNWQESLYDSTSDFTSRNPVVRKLLDTRQRMMYWGSKPIAMADALSSEPTWLAAYTQERDAGGAHGDGVAAGDRAVRRAHGSTSGAGQPMIMSHLTPWVTTMYNFFNDILNRAVETGWRAGDMLGTRGRPKDWSLAPGVAAGIFSTAIWTAIVENLVNPLPTQPGDSTAGRILKGSVHSVAAMFPVIRDFVGYITGSDAPDVGLMTTEYKALGEALKDFGKKAPFNPAHAEKLIRDWGTMLGAIGGAPGMQIGRDAGFAYGLATGAEHPRGPWGDLVGIRFGTTKGHSQTLEDYMAGRSSPNR